jgi:hypothetical protein
VKNYRVTIRLNVETEIPSSREMEAATRRWLDALEPDFEFDFYVASVTAYEDVLFKDVA